MYKIIFIDDTIFEGGRNLLNSQWNDIPDKPIKQLVYNLFGKTIFLENFESYNHLVERLNVIFGNFPYPIISVTLMGLTKGKIKKFVFDLIKKELKIIEVIEGREFKGMPSTGWKIGIPNQNPTYKII